MPIFYILCGADLTAVMIVPVWKRVVPLKSIWTRIPAALCNPMMLAGIAGNLLTLLPWPFRDLDRGTESFGHAPVLFPGLVLLRETKRNGELEEADACSEIGQRGIMTSAQAPFTGSWIRS